MKFPFDELNMRDPEHVDWVKSQRDPELWHVAAIAVVNYLGDPRGFLVWLMDQPETDRATAGYIFLGVKALTICAGRPILSAKDCPARSGCSAMEAICRRAATLGFTNDSLGLHPGFEAERQACLDLINRGQVADGIAVPHAIARGPFPPEQKLRYFIEDGAVLDYDPSPFLKR